jgi:hypothetical protein
MPSTPAVTGKIGRYEDFRIVNGHLLRKTEMLLLLHSAKQLSDAVGEMVAEIQGDLWTAAACGHVAWKHLYTEVLGWTPPSRPESARRKTCLWTHEKSCSKCEISTETQASLDYKRKFLPMKPCEGDITRREDDSLSTTEAIAAVGVVFSCEKCYTDISLCFVDDLGPGGRVCVLSSWKDLGTGEGLDSPQWQSHHHRTTRFGNRGRKAAPHIRKVGQISGSVFEAYEKDTGQYRDG